MQGQIGVAIGIHFPNVFMCILLFIAFAAFGFWVWMMIDCPLNEPSEGNDKLVWMLVILVTNWIGALIYYFVRRPERIRIIGH
jgi:hypothetical protein